MPLFAVHVCVIRYLCHEINMSELYLCPILQEKAQLKWPGACCLALLQLHNVYEAA